MLVDDFSRSSTLLSQHFNQDDAKYFLYFDHSDDLHNNTLSIKSESSFFPEPEKHLFLSRSQYLAIVQKQKCSPIERKKMMVKFIKNQRNLRRERAKERLRLKDKIVQENFKVKIQREYQQEREDITDKSETDRRKKRLSAQISRDKKKTYLKNLQKDNINLKKQLLKLMCEKNNLINQLQIYRNCFQSNELRDQISRRYQLEM